MNSGLQKGISAEFAIQVTADMRPSFDGEVVHQVMSTVNMIYYMERAGRYVILPYLEENEEGAGYRIDVKHIGPAVVGQTVVFRAVCTEVTEKRVVCEVFAWTDRNQVGIGTFTQAIFNKEEITRRFAELQAQVASETQKA